jgi:hypothetical protein
MSRHLPTALRVIVAVAVAYVGWTFVSRALSEYRLRRYVDEEQTRRNAEFLRVYGGNSVKILQFYARDLKVTEGTNSVICYGVINARTVRMEPPTDFVTPSLNKCVEVTPTKETRYTLIAEGNDGQLVSESFVLGMQPDVETLPKITSFNVMSQSLDYLGHPVYLVGFNVQNPEEVSIDPPAFPALHRAPYGRFYVAPPKDTTYTLTVVGKFGHKTSQQLRLAGPKG